MAYEEYGMWEVLDVLRRHWRGERKRAIAAATGRDRNTVRRYIARALKAGWGGRSEPDEALASRIVGQLQPGGEGAGEAQQALMPHRERITEWLAPVGGGRGLRLTKAHALLSREGVVVSYTALRRFAREQCGLRSQALTVRLEEVAPGELAEIDFGRM